MLKNMDRLNVIHAKCNAHNHIHLKYTFTTLELKGILHNQTLRLVSCFSQYHYYTIIITIAIIMIIQK